MMERIKIYGLFFLVGAAAYWGSDALVQLIHPPHPIWILLLTAGVPFVVGLVWYRLFRTASFKTYPKAFPLVMLLGIWALGPVAMAVVAQLQGGTFMDAEKLGGFLVVWAMFPMTTFVMSTYSGSLGGLLITTVLLPILSLVASRKLRTSDNVPRADASLRHPGE